MSQSKQSVQTPRPNLTVVRRHAQAKRMVDTKSLDKPTWLAYRQKGIGSSDAGAAVGLNPYKSQLALWMEKTGRSIQPVSDEEPDQDSALHWGTVLEPIVAKQYALRTGHKVRRVNAILQHPTHPWMLANLDREVIGDNEVQVLECKTAGINGAKLWRNGVPEYVQVQVMHQLAVTGQQAADVAVLIGGQKLEIHRIERDEAMIEKIIQLEAAFWEYVKNDTPPPADHTDSAAKALQYLYPTDNSDTVDFSENAKLNQVYDDLVTIRLKISELQKLEAQCKHSIQESMQQASVALFANGKVTWKQSNSRQVLDTKALKKDYGELCDQYLVEQAGSRRFLVYAA